MWFYKFGQFFGISFSRAKNIGRLKVKYLIGLEVSISHKLNFSLFTLLQISHIRLSRLFVQFFDFYTLYQVHFCNQTSVVFYKIKKYAQITFDSSWRTNVITIVMVLFNNTLLITQIHESTVQFSLTKSFSFIVCIPVAAAKDINTKIYISLINYIW